MTNSSPDWRSKDVRGEIVRLTSRMLDNPDDSGIYPTTQFYNALEAFIAEVEAEARQTGRDEAVGYIMQHEDESMMSDEEIKHHASVLDAARKEPSE